MIRAFPVLLIGAFLLEAAGYLAFPYLSVGLRDEFALTETQIGWVFLVATGLRPLWAILGGVLAEKICPVFLFSIGCLAESVCFLLLGLGHSASLGIFAIILGNLGFSIWTPNLFGLVYKTFPADEATRWVSILNGTLNAGAAVGCLVGAWIVSAQVREVFTAASLLYLVTLAVFVWILRAEKAESPAPSTGGVRSLGSRELWAMVPILIVVLGFWGSYAQFNSFFALFAKDWLGNTSLTGIAFGTLAVGVAFFSFLVSRVEWLRKNLGLATAASGVALSLAWLFQSAALSTAGSLVFVVALSVGEALFMLYLAECWARVNPHRQHLMQSLNFASRNLAMAVGNAIGGYTYLVPQTGTIWLWAGTNAALIALAVSAVAMTPKAQGSGA